MIVSSRNILTTSCLLILPTVSLITIFSWLLYQYQVRPNQLSVIEYNGTRTILGLDRDAFYIRLDSTILLALASCMSTITPLLAGSAVALAAYPMAQGLLMTTPQNDCENLTTPYQLALLIRLLRESSYIALWSLGKYWLSRKRRNKCVPVLRYLALIVVTSTLLSVLVFATDVWLHVVTTTISVPMASAIAGAQADYSLSLKSDCSVTNNSYVALYRANTTCNVGPVGRIIELDDPGLHYETLNNQSTKLSIVQYEANQSISYLSVSPAAVDPSYDFKATTIGIQMNCKTISDDCDLSFTGSSAYNCSNGAFAETNSNFNRDGGFNMQSFKYPNMSDTADPYRAYGIHNPFYWTAALRTPSSLYGTANLSNSGFIYNLGVVSTVLLCEVTVLDVEYESVQGQVTHLSTSMASDSTANIFNLVPASQVLGEFGWTNVQTAVQLAAILTKDTEDFISRFAKSLSNTLLSSGVGAVQQAPSLVAQQRINTLVTKMPKTPFYTFLGITCAFIFMGGVLTGLALWSTEEARAVKMRLSASGLVAAMFEGGGSRKQVQRVEEMFAEYAGSTEEVKIGFDRTDEGGFQFRAHRSNKEDEIVVMWEQTQHQRIEQPKNDHQSEFPHSGTFHGYLIQ